MIPGGDRWRSDDPLAGLDLPTFDDQGATSREDRLAAVMAGARSIHDERERQRAQELEAVAKVGRRRQRRRRVRRVLTGAVVVAVILGAGLVLRDNPSVRASLDELAAGVSSDEPTTTAGPPTTRRIPNPTTTDLSPPSTEADVVVPPPPRGDRPTPQRAESTVPLGSPPPVEGDGPFEFTVVGSDGEPARYDPCRPIAVVVNNRLAPPNGDELVDSALAEVSRATGLQFVREGESDESITTERQPYQPDRFGNRWAPLLIAWSDAETNPELVGDTVGQGGSSWLETDGHSVFLSGAIVLDAPDLAEIALLPQGYAELRAVLLHELGHVVGLAHVDDPSQLMYADAGEVVEFGAGDLAGLAQLGQGPCIPRL